MADGAWMSLVVTFSDDRIAHRCNSAVATEQAWGSAARDVRESLCVLASSPGLDAYADHPNVAHEGDLTVYKGRVVDVLLGLSPADGPTPGVQVENIDIRDRGRSTT